jgi:hypothetical protein
MAAPTRIHQVTRRSHFQTRHPHLRPALHACAICFLLSGQCYLTSRARRAPHVYYPLAVLATCYSVCTILSSCMACGTPQISIILILSCSCSTGTTVYSGPSTCGSPTATTCTYNIPSFKYEPDDGELAIHPNSAASRPRSLQLAFNSSVGVATHT